MPDTNLPPPPIPRPAIRHSRPTTTGETVTVACKLPSGLILRMFEEYQYQEPSQTGMRDVRAFRPLPNKTWTIRGTYVASAGQAYMPGNSAVAELLPGGYALTYGVPKEIWDNWLHYNRDTAMVQRKVIWAMPSMHSATEEAKTLRQVKSGLEPVDRANPAARLPGGGTRADRQLRIEQLPREEVG